MKNTNRERKGPFRRLWQNLLAWERAMDYSPYDHVLDRVGALEREVGGLRDEMTHQTDGALTKIRGTETIRY